VAVGIFIIHIVTLILLIVVGGGYLLLNGTATLFANLQTAPPGGLWTALIFGFAAAMLGVSGFESSANFVEEQADGVFPKTLRNMWVAVTVFNPMMALLALALVPIAEVAPHQEALLSYMGKISGGTWLSWLISIDAALVLSGAVLTSYVGVNGLILRMTLDRCLPQFLLKSNSRGTFHRIIIAFFLLAVSILLITGGELKALAGVYTLSFLSVMALFGLGNILLKVKRARLPRPTQAGWTKVIVGIAAVLVGLVGNAVMNPPYLRVFLNYFIPAMLIIMIMLTRISILKGCLFLVRVVNDLLYNFLGHVRDTISKKIEVINSQQVVFFTRGDNVANLNNAILYVRDNEHTNRIKIVTVVKDKKEVPDKLKSDVKFLEETYPHIDIELLIEEDDFGPELIQELSAKWNIPANLMFIGSPGGKLKYSQAELGGVRLVI
jgi:amino acid transporter